MIWIGVLNSVVEHPFFLKVAPGSLPDAFGTPMPSWNPIGLMPVHIAPKLGGSVWNAEKHFENVKLWWSHWGRIWRERISQTCSTHSECNKRTLSRLTFYPIEKSFGGAIFQLVICALFAVKLTVASAGKQSNFAAICTVADMPSLFSLFTSEELPPRME